MLRRLWLMVAVVALAALLVSGCDASPGRSGTGTSSSTQNGLLYVATGSSILRFNNALSATGNVIPQATMSGTATQLFAPQHLLLDTSTDRLFVANAGGASILMFRSASTKNFNVVPDAVLTSPSMGTPIDIAIDTSINNFLFVADGSNILVFTGQSTLSGTLSTLPVHTINTSLLIGAIFFDVANNRLFVTDLAGNGVSILDNATTQSGTALVTGTIAGPNTQLGGPDGLALDNLGRLVVSNASAARITIFPSNAIPSGGNIAPVATITGPQTQLVSPGQILVNPSAGSTGELVVLDPLAVSVLTFPNVATLTVNDNPAPIRTIGGTVTGLNTTISGIALDPTR
jgi:hypothetical protein